MSLKITIDAEIKKAMLAKDADSLRALRGIKSLILLAETDKANPNGLTAEVEAKIIQKAVKQRKESADIFITQNRQDLADIELKEIAVMEKFLPAQLSESEIEAVIKTVIESTGAKSAAEMGKVMGAASKELAGKADNKVISEIVKRLLSN